MEGDYDQTESAGDATLPGVSPAAIDTGPIETVMVNLQRIFPGRRRGDARFPQR
jgi:hypothetical protein